MDVFRNLSSVDAKIREAATLNLVQELQEVQTIYEQSSTEGNDDGDLKLEAAKDACLKNCAPTMKYAIRQLICGISSSRIIFLSSKLNLVRTPSFLLFNLESRKLPAQIFLYTIISGLHYKCLLILQS